MWIAVLGSGCSSTMLIEAKDPDLLNASSCTTRHQCSSAAPLLPQVQVKKDVRLTLGGWMLGAMCRLQRELQ